MIAAVYVRDFMMFPRTGGANPQRLCAHTFVLVIPTKWVSKPLRRADSQWAGSPARGHTRCMAEDLEVRKGIVIPAAELRWRFSRSSGPGGQSVNTTDSRVSLSYDITSTTALDEHLRARALERLAGQLVDGVLTIHAEAQRSQYQNRTAAQEQLAKILNRAIAPPPAKRRATRPSRRAKDRRIAGKKQRGETKRLRRSVED